MKRPVHVSVVRNRVIRGDVVVDLADRVAELETGVAEHLRQLPDLDRFLDELEPVLTRLVSPVDRTSEQSPDKESR